MTARMLGTCQHDFCPYHRSRGYGNGCPSTARAKGSQRRREERAWKRLGEAEVRSNAC